MPEKHRIIPVWFFVGFLLLVYGILILASGIYELSRPPDVVLTNLHAPVWWGALLVVIGIVYCVMFRPGKTT
jgi:multisubunit Na+/H+ antiporter MnhG subunit